MRPNFSSILAQSIVLLRAMRLWRQALLRKEKRFTNWPTADRLNTNTDSRISFLGDETVTQIIFGPAEAEPILGVVALESMGMVVDPITKTLKRIHAKPLKRIQR